MSGDKPDDRPFAERAWHTCWSCRYDDGRGVGGSPPWHECTIMSQAERQATDEGVTCNRYSPLSWAIAPNTKDQDHG